MCVRVGGVVVLLLILVCAVGSAQLCRRLERARDREKDREGEWLLDDDPWSSSDDEEERQREKREVPRAERKERDGREERGNPKAIGAPRVQASNEP